MNLIALVETEAQNICMCLPPFTLNRSSKNLWKSKKTGKKTKTSITHNIVKQNGIQKNKNQNLQNQNQFLALGDDRKTKWRI